MTAQTFSNSPATVDMLTAGFRDAVTIAQDLSTMRDAIAELQDLMTEDMPASVEAARTALLAEFRTEAEDLTDLLLGAIL